MRITFHLAGPPARNAPQGLGVWPRAADAAQAPADVRRAWRAFARVRREDESETGDLSRENARNAKKKTGNLCDLCSFAAKRPGFLWLIVPRRQCRGTVKVRPSGLKTLFAVRGFAPRE